MLKVNVLILGKSGCGKSSLLNYLWGAKIADVAAGRPVTPESDSVSQGIYRHPPVQLDGLQLVIHDSWGMEANKAEKWQALIKQESSKYDASYKISDWIHTVVYCVSAKGARIEDFELDSIIAPLIDEGSRVLFVLTKADIASKREKEAIGEILTSHFPKNSGIIETNSICQVLRSGQRTEAFGREEMLGAILSNLRQNLIAKIPVQLLLRAREGSKKLRHDAIAHYEKEAGWSRYYPSLLKEIGSLVENDSRQLGSDLRKWLTQVLMDAVAIYGLVGTQLGPESVGAGHGTTLDGEAFLSKSRIAWDWDDYIGNLRFALFPVISILFPSAQKDMHRNTLIKKLDEGITHFDKEVEAVAKQIRARLGEVLRIPAPA